MSIWRFVFVFVFFSVSNSRFLSAIPVAASKTDQSAIGQQVSPSPSAGTEKSQAQATPPTDTKADYSKEGFVVEKLHERYLFENDGTGHKIAILRVHVLSDAGVQGFGQLRFGYNSANDRMEIGYVRVIKPDGKVVTAAPDAVQEVSGAVQQNAPVYTDYREKHVTVPGLRPGDVMECEVTTIFHTAMAPGQFWMEHDFNESSIVLDEKLEIDVPGRRTVKLKSKPGFDPKITEENGRRIYRWETSHLVRENVREDAKETDKKKKSKARADKFPDVQMTTFGSWEEVGRWYAGLEKERRMPSREVRDKAAELTRGLNSDLEKSEALYDFVAKNFRYVSLSLGLARYQPQAAADVLHNQYGDCKDKNTLLAALLEAEGMHSSTVLISSVRKLDPDVPAPSQFNHVITKLQLGKEDLWMDTTTEVAPFQLLSYQLRKKQALVIPEGGVPHLEATPADSPVPDEELAEVTGKIDDAGKLEATVRYTLRGDAELVQRLIFRHIAAAQWQKYIEGLNKSIGGSVSNVRAGDPSATREPFTIAYDVSKAGFVDWTKQKIQLKLPLAQLNLASVSSDIGMDTDSGTDKEGEDEDPAASNTENFKLGPRNDSTYRLKLELAPRYTADVPVPTTLDRDYGAYQSTYKFEANTFTAERKLTIRKAELPPARADDYRSFRQAALADAAQHLTLQSASVDLHNVPTGMKAAELARSGNEARKNGNYTLAIDLLNHATEADPKSRAAWNELGIAYFDDQQDGLAINAFQKQIGVNPYHDNAYDNLGRVYLRQRKYDEAEKWFLKQLEIQPLHLHALTNLGIAYLETDKFEAALPYLEKAASLALDDATCQVRLGQAYLNLGQNDKAMMAFDKAVKISATPGIWNDIAYQLALKNTHLDLARQYAESAVSGTSARLRNVSLDQIKRRDLSLVSSLEIYWDTLGWVAFAEGKLDPAEKYVAAAWQLGMGSDEGDHLAQIYEKQGKKEQAQLLYAAALNARRPEPDTRTRLAVLAGGEGKADAMVEKSRNELLSDRTIPISNPSKLDGNADFFILQSAGHGPSATIEDVTFIRGNEKVKALTDGLRGSKLSQKLPDDTPVKIVRRGTLSCKPDTDCTFQLALPEDVKSVD